MEYFILLHVILYEIYYFVLFCSCQDTSWRSSGFSEIIRNKTQEGARKERERETFIRHKQTGWEQQTGVRNPDFMCLFCSGTWAISYILIRSQCMGLQYRCIAWRSLKRLFTTSRFQKTVISAKCHSFEYVRTRFICKLLTAKTLWTGYNWN